jgi:hypothetical protein
MGRKISEEGALRQIECGGYTAYAWKRKSERAEL